MTTSISHSALGNVRDSTSAHTSTAFFVLPGLFPRGWWNLKCSRPPSSSSARSRSGNRSPHTGGNNRYPHRCDSIAGRPHNARHTKHRHHTFCASVSHTASGLRYPASADANSWHRTISTNPPNIAANLQSIHAFAGLYTLRSALRLKASRAAAFLAVSMRRAASAALLSLGFRLVEPDFVSTPKSAATAAFHSDCGTTTGAPLSPLPTSESFSVLLVFDDPLEPDGWETGGSGRVLRIYFAFWTDRE